MYPVYRDAVMALLEFGRQSTWSSSGNRWLSSTISWILLERERKKLLTGGIGLHSLLVGIICIIYVCFGFISVII